jgi:hypothetical protein
MVPLFWQWITPTNATTATAVATPFFSQTTSATNTVWQWHDDSQTAVAILNQPVWYHHQLDIAQAQAALYYQQGQQAACHQSLQDHYLAQAQTAQMQQAAYERYAFALHRPTLIDRMYAPAVITHQEQARRDEELYRRALAECNEQEAARILRLIEQREQTEAARLAAIQAQAQRANEELQRRQAASDRANQLLLDHLTPAQRDTYTKNGWFIVQGGRSKTKYRIRSGSLVANVDVLRDASSRRC